MQASARVSICLTGPPRRTNWYRTKPWLIYPGRVAPRPSQIYMIFIYIYIYIYIYISNDSNNCLKPKIKYFVVNKYNLSIEYGRNVGNCIHAFNFLPAVTPLDPRFVLRPITLRPEETKTLQGPHNIWSYATENRSPDSYPIPTLLLYFVDR